MALVNCPECGREKVSDQAEHCPDCGYGIKAHYAEIKLQKQEEEEKQNQVKPSAGGSFGSSNDGNTQTEVLTDGIQGKYYAPVQQQGLYFYGGPPVHDLGASEGSKLYAGMDGTATFYQAYTIVNGTKKLYSYP